MWLDSTTVGCILLMHKYWDSMKAEDDMCVMLSPYTAHYTCESNVSLCVCMSVCWWIAFISGPLPSLLKGTRGGMDEWGEWRGNMRGRDGREAGSSTLFTQCWCEPRQVLQKLKVGTWTSGTVVFQIKYALSQIHMIWLTRFQYRQYTHDDICVINYSYMPPGNKLLEKKSKLFSYIQNKKTLAGLRFHFDPLGSSLNCHALTVSLIIVSFSNKCISPAGGVHALHQKHHKMVMLEQNMWQTVTLWIFDLSIFFLFSFLLSFSLLILRSLNLSHSTTFF